MKRLFDKGIVYLTRDGADDDTFMLYAAFSSGLATEIISNDHFRDQMDFFFTSFGVQVAKDIQRWHRGHQTNILIRRMVNSANTNLNGGLPAENVIKFFRARRHNIIGQNTHGMWHIPGPSESWICCQPIRSALL